MFVDIALRALASVFKPLQAPVEPFQRVMAFVGFLILGTFAGEVSLLLFSHPLVHPSRIHGISLLVSPVVTGSIMSLVGSALRRHDKQTVVIESFAYGFAFAFGMALCRYFGMN